MWIVLVYGLAILFGSRFHSFARNYIAARRLKIPILLSPVSWQDPLWMLVGNHFAFLRHLPFGLGAWSQYSQLGWQMYDKYYMHEKLGPAFVIVSPYQNEITIADPDAATEILSKWKLYGKSPILYTMFNIFGKNVNTVNGEEWSRHRKITASAFKESNFRIVWNATCQQATALSKRWATSKEVDMTDLMNEAALLAMDVLAIAGFGREYNADEGLEMPEAGHQMSYAAALSSILHNVMGTILFEYLAVPSFILSRNLRTLKTAVKEFKKYLAERVADERQKAAMGETVKDNLMSSLVAANEAASNESPEKSIIGMGNRRVLTDEELYGNLFIFNVAGYETTAETMSVSIPRLAIHVDVQDWVAEEVEAVLGDREETVYEDTWPRLVRTRAVMYETLRILPPLPAQPRNTLSQPQVLKVEGKELAIPSNTFVSINYAALQTFPKYWDADSLVWKPARWVKPGIAGQEEFIEHGKDGTFSAWAGGSRICPGKKFSQVEFVAAVASLLRGYRVEPARRDGEMMEDATSRLSSVIEDLHYNVTPRPNRPKDAGIVWVRR